HPPCSWERSRSSERHPATPENAFSPARRFPSRRVGILIRVVQRPTPVLKTGELALDRRGIVTRFLARMQFRPGRRPLDDRPEPVRHRWPRLTRPPHGGASSAKTVDPTDLRSPRDAGNASTSLGDLHLAGARHWLPAPAFVRGS